MNITVVATFPDPNSIDSLKGGYRRVTELIKLLSYEKKNRIKPFIISNSKYDLAIDGCDSVSLVYCRSILLRMIKSFFVMLSNRKCADVIILYNPTYLTLPVLFLKYFGSKIIIDYVDLQGTAVEGGKKFLRKCIEIFMLAKCNYFLTSSCFLRRRILAHNPDAKILMYRGVFNKVEYHPPYSFEKKKDNNVNIMYLGLMGPVSGVDILMKAFDSLRHENARLYIVGQGHMKDNLIKLAGSLGNRSIVFKSLSDDDLHPFMLKMDILTIPYIKDKRNRANFPSKIIEYLWCGKAILATNVGEIPQVLENNRTALLVESDDIDAIKDGLNTLILNNKLRDRLGRNARDYFENNYTSTISIKRINEFFEKVMLD